MIYSPTHIPPPSPFDRNSEPPPLTRAENRVGLLNSLAGLISTLINVYSQQRGRFSITAKITLAATASCTLVTAALYFLYNFWILQGVRKKHEEEWGEGV